MSAAVGLLAPMTAAGMLLKYTSVQSVCDVILEKNDVSAPSGISWVGTAPAPCGEVLGAGNCGLFHCFANKDSEVSNCLTFLQVSSSWREHT